MATFIKGNDVANATSYELFEKNGSSYASLATAEEINFEVSALGLSAGSHTLVVKAKADGYADSDYSNELEYTESAELIYDIDLTAITFSQGACAATDGKYLNNNLAIRRVAFINIDGTYNSVNVTLPNSAAYKYNLVYYNHEIVATGDIHTRYYIGALDAASWVEASRQVDIPLGTKTIAVNIAPVDSSATSISATKLSEAVASISLIKIDLSDAQEVTVSPTTMTAYDGVCSAALDNTYATWLNASATAGAIRRTLMCTVPEGAVAYRIMRNTGYKYNCMYYKSEITSTSQCNASNCSGALGTNWHTDAEQYVLVEGTTTLAIGLAMESSNAVEFNAVDAISEVTFYIPSVE